MKSKKIKIVVIALALVVIVIAVFVKFYIFRKADTSVASRNADVVIEAGDLVKSFDQDEKTANVKYLNKIVMVNGIVDDSCRVLFFIFDQLSDGVPGVIDEGC